MNGTDLILNGEIVLEGYIYDHETCEWLGPGHFSSRMVRDALSAFDGEVTVRVNSHGGSPFEGEAVRAAFEAHPGKVTAIVNGIAASAASLMIMGAARIEMSAGSHIMIHEPSGSAFGRADVLAAEAESLRTLGSTYANVYADRSNMTSEQIQAWMKAETFLGADASVQAGLADAVTGQAQQDMSEDEAVEKARAEMASHNRRYLMMMQKIQATGGKPGALSSVSMTAEQEAQEMPNENAQQTSPETPTTAPAVETSANVTMSAVQNQQSEAVQMAIAGERQRQSDIRAMAAPYVDAGQLTQMQVNEVIDQGVTMEGAGARFMSLMAETQTRIVPATVAGSRQDETETRMEGMIEALMSNYDGPGAQFRGMRLRSLAMELGGGRGFNENQRIADGMRATTMMGGAHGVSDFAYITTEVMNRSLLAQYERRAANWVPLAGTPMEASDFRELHAARFGGSFQLKTVQENGEYEEATLVDQAEGLKVERRGRKINITFEAVVNDDMGAFNRIPQEFAVASRLMEATMVWSLIRKNAALKSDGKSIFHADHNNIATGGKISPVTVGNARKLMWEQRAYGSEDADEDFLMIEPDLLIVPPALETDAGRFVSDFTPAKTDDANPYRSSVTPIVAPHLGKVAGGSDEVWYLGSSDLPPISVAYLEGYQAPVVRTVEGMNPDMVTMTARHIFGAATSEFRGIVKNPGK